MLVKHHNTITYGTKSLTTLGLRYGNNYQKTLNQRHLIPNLRNILILGPDQLSIYVREYFKVYQLKFLPVTCQRTVIYFNVLIAVLARI